MDITINIYKLTVSEKNAKAYLKMYNHPITETDTKVYIMSSFPSMKFEDILNTKTQEQLEEALNSSLQVEAISCYGYNFYRDV